MNILVVDDEYLARESLIKSLRQCGFADIYEAANGLEAYDLMQSMQPEIVIADIRMPGMDGIELLEKVKAEFGGVILIFLSGYDYFEYAQKAVNLGAFHYLLKPFKEEELIAIINSAVQRLHEQKQQREANYQYRVMANQGLRILRRQFILELLTQKPFRKAHFQSKAAELKVRFLYPDFCVVIVSIDSDKQPSPGFRLKDNDGLIQNSEAKIQEILGDFQIDAYSFYRDDHFGFLLNFNESGPAYPRLGEACRKLRQTIAERVQTVVTIGVGSIVTELSGLPDAYQTAFQAMDLKLVKGPNQIFVYEAKTNPREESSFIIYKTEAALSDSFEHCEQTAAVAILEKLYAPFRTASGVEIERLKKLNLQLILLIYKILNQLAIPAEELLGDEFNLYNQVNSCAGFDSMLAWFVGKLAICFEAIRAAREKGPKKLIEKAKNFIRENVNQELTLESVAAHVHLSPTYFSKLFRQEVGENFIDYVAAYRISLAKKFLKEGIYKASQVCRMVGFHDVKHFYKVFKKLTGFTPSEYKEL